MEPSPEGYPSCYGDLDTVFPLMADGLRGSPDHCMACAVKTECLRSALAAQSGTRVAEERIDRAYASGMIGFLQRWSEKKKLYRRQPAVRETATDKKEVS